MDVNLIRIVFIFNAVSTGIVGLLISALEHCLPVFLTRTYRYGKYAVTKDHAFVSRFEVPKRWFKHFYVFAAPASSIVLALVISTYFYGGKVPEMFYWILDVQLGIRRRALVSPESTVLGILLLTIHCLKRLYETHCVSIFSDKKMNLSHYIIGFVHYIGTISCVVGESDGFVRGSNGREFRWELVSKSHCACAIIFCLASYEQLRTNYILANLRKDKKKGDSESGVTRLYKIPRGRLFEYISAPLQLTEIIVYTMLSVILSNGSTYHYVFFWVLVNQAATAILTHQWYIITFPNYPTERKAFIPYLL